MKQKRMAAINIGANSTRGILVEVAEKTSFRVLDDKNVTVRLGEGLLAIVRHTIA